MAYPYPHSKHSSLNPLIDTRLLTFFRPNPDKPNNQIFTNKLNSRSLKETLQEQIRFKQQRRNEQRLIRMKEERAHLLLNPIPRTERGPVNKIRNRIESLNYNRSFFFKEERSKIRQENRLAFSQVSRRVSTEPFEHQFRRVLSRREDQLRSFQSLLKDIRLRQIQIISRVQKGD